MNLELKMFESRLIIINTVNNKKYDTADETDMKILCKEVNQELNYVVLRHNLAIQTLINIEDLLRKSSDELKYVETVKR